MIGSISDVRLVRPVSANIPQDRILPYIEEIERTSVIQVLGAELYENVDAAPEKYSELLDGGYYTASDGERRWFGGLRKAIGYLVYARLVRNQQMNVTAFGAVVKNGQLSEQADNESVARMSNEAQSMGEAYLNACADYCAASGFLCAAEKKFTKKFYVIGD